MPLTASLFLPILATRNKRGRMGWDGKNVRQLRQRLAWSQAEMARRLGCMRETLAKWESENVIPDENYNSQLDSLLRHVESQAEQLSRSPVAEALMTNLNLTQIHTDQIDRELNNPKR